MRYNPEGALFRPDFRVIIYPNPENNEEEKKLVEVLEQKVFLMKFKKLIFINKIYSLKRLKK